MLKQSLLIAVLALVPMTVLADTAAPTASGHQVAMLGKAMRSGAAVGSDCYYHHRHHHRHHHRP